MGCRLNSQEETGGKGGVEGRLDHHLGVLKTGGGMRAVPVGHFRRGLTLLELLLALAVVSLIGLGLTGMLFGLVRGADSQGHIEELVVARQVLAARLGSVVRQAEEIRSVSAEQIVLGLSDGSSVTLRWDSQAEQILKIDSAGSWALTEPGTVREFSFAVQGRLVCFSGRLSGGDGSEPVVGAVMIRN